MLQTVAEYPVEEVLAHVSNEERVWDGYRVWMGSSRYKLFRKSLVCVTCNCVGSVFRLEYEGTQKERPSDRAHFNLYAKVGTKMVLMTKDHIIPKSKGGKNTLGNYRTMCVQCNMRRGNGDPK